jgi:predicted Na+-dependent transporter
MSPMEKVIALVFVTTYMLQIGLLMPMGGLRSACSRHKGPLVWGVLLLMVGGPLVTYFVVRAFGLHRPADAGLVLLSVVGLAPLAPKQVRRAKGNVAFAIVLTFAVAVIAIFTAVPSARFLLSYERPLTLRPGPLLLKLLVLQGVPLAFGLFVRRRVSAAQRNKAGKVLGAVNAVALVVLFALVVAPRLSALRSLGWAGAAAAVVVSLILAALGWAVGGPSDEGRRTLASVVDVSNFPLALVITQDAGVPPEASVVILGGFLLRAIVGIAVSAFLGRRRVASSPVAPVTP